MSYSYGYEGYENYGPGKCDCPSCSLPGYDQYPNYGYEKPYPSPSYAAPYPPYQGVGYGGYGGFWYAIVVVVVILLIIFGAGGWNYVKGYLPKGYL
ncbi:hypothetical protein CIB95_02060 [Lottiidibacillus patelloidae]|uniref:Sporulation protein YjcZ n=1 Tax=Lottiidibacillus patelloidae TaxID=2670334 RepID=A0A263BYL0_9BACI|nr:hypothetical protein [Lottiidibacillus patelloidae]OZM58377.1 hypothetical protein CIB95_02060 [Lottiidibacillus patelloidae]